ncbi:MAG TPA: hypothetical protein VMZ74_02085 [Ramlibacter sp.]|nr:hypothetical protein [Ramlibacter sp.]
MSIPTQRGITPPVPGQDKEEPDLWQEDDIPVDNNDRASASDEVNQDEPKRERRDE